MYITLFTNEHKRLTLIWLFAFSVDNGGYLTFIWLFAFSVDNGGSQKTEILCNTWRIVWQTRTTKVLRIILVAILYINVANTNIYGSFE